MQPMLLTEKEAAAVLKLAPATLRRWRWAGDGPVYCRLGLRSVRYRTTDLDAFVSAVAGTTAR